ncbi:thiamine-phosphate kinase [Pseudobacteriovorax antillogorgiicola]|uniref:Thiamine-monophosphate kinase n=1 Tax=Pseudobacteriovorax antillogorgiicola TaxID=1513793 RepID=A0A1Y6BP78_9BACT|nr:thiamine-phosphate kinase [Pseudobacteriovorax antillogorgiicola]TCS53881.1 thiamine-phosphate kinase [Pseudobacteriovorax antillogorgiicola]SMF21079.1 thiamine-monophosphate kinase [Pseudobacteriovorax antillogorgiicola]
MTELKLIESIRSQVKPHPNVMLGIGDDCAVLQSHPQAQLVTTDTLMDGRHFICGDTPPALIGRKSLAVSISDIAAMGGVPEAAFVSLVIPQRKESQPLVEGLMSGIVTLADKFHIAIAGGDSNSWSGPLVVSITLTGRPHHRGPVRRSGAKPGDSIFVTGPLGGSIDDHHLNFEPRTFLAKELLDLTPITSMIDLSDGLATDLRHICSESAVSAQLNPEAIPFRSNITHLDTRLEKALTDGEDFELCFSLNPKGVETLKRAKLSQPIYHVGTIVKQGPNALQWNDGTAIISTGFEHGF